MPTLPDPVLVNMEQAREWSDHPKIVDPPATGNMTTEQAKQHMLDADLYVMSETGDFAPQETDNDFRLKSLAATYIAASFFMGTWKTPTARQDVIDLKALGDAYIAAVNRGAGKVLGQTSKKLFINSYRNYRLNPNASPYLSQF